MDPAKLELLPDTPMWKQFREIKGKALDSLLFYRMGDFYELFLEDAVIAANVLGITLTARHKKQAHPVAMCGVPFHSATAYINKLLAAGHRVAICEQVSKPGEQKGIVKREIVRVVSPGVAYDHDALEESEHNYLMAVSFMSWGGSYCATDLSTGDSLYGSFSSVEDFFSALSFLQPKEIILSVSQDEKGEWEKVAPYYDDKKPCITVCPDYYFAQEAGFEDLCRHFGVNHLEAFNLSRKSPELGSINAIFRKMKESKVNLCHLQPPRENTSVDCLHIDDSTIDHLDLFPKADRNASESLFFHINRTTTALGVRMLRKMLLRPLQNVSKIQARQRAIKELLQSDLLIVLRSQLSGIKDVERLVAKLGLQSASPRDLFVLGETLARIPEIKKILQQLSSSPLLSHIESKLGSFPSIVSLLSKSLRDDAPVHTREGKIFKKGWNGDLDELINLSTHAQDLIISMEEEERKKTGIHNLKIKYNRVFGYAIEITKSHLKLVPPHYVRKQTTIHAERFITEELKLFEHKVLSAEESRISLEASLFNTLIETISRSSKEILKTAKQVAYLDALQGLATVAQEKQFQCPEITEGMDLFIEEGRHPIVEALIGRDHFIPNTIECTEREKFFLLTGPNMGGKSTYMRQVALLTLLAHTGSFIPAKRAVIGLVDRIASRVGASDRIGQGQSTFMVEMSETARILRQATKRSLLIIDEIGRGTSTFDGLALAWAILEDIHSRLGCRTIFATHYHELTDLEKQLEGVKNLSVLVEERDGTILFLHKVSPGTASGSYGVQVAKLAGLPDVVVRRAASLLETLEKKSPPSPPKASKTPEKIIKKRLSPLEEELKSLDINQCTPMDTFLKVKEFQEKLNTLEI